MYCGIGSLSFRQKLEYVSHLLKAVFRDRIKFYDAVLSAHVGRRDIILDVGANAGQFTKKFARLAPEGHVYAFEPGSYAFGILEKVAIWHRLSNVTLLRKGLGAAPGRATLSLPVKASGVLGFSMSSMGADVPRDDMSGTLREDVEITSIDSFVAEAGLARVDFVKCDVEGFEYEVLKGAAATINRDKPRLLLEVVDASLQRAGANGSELWDFLVRDRGYTAFPVCPDGAGDPAPEFSKDWDYLFLPPGTPAPRR